MRNVDLEKFYGKIDGSIKLIAAWSEDKTLEQIIRSCRLKPYSLFTRMEYGTNLEKHWVDEYGNSLIVEEKNVQIVSNDLSIEKDTRISTDLFYGRNIEYFIETGKSALITYNIVSIYGDDQYLRSFVFDEQRWVNISPLMIGIDVLRDFFSHKIKTISLPRCRDEVERHIITLQKGE